MKSSKEILKQTSISRATLNNYINYGLLSKPKMFNPGEAGGPRQLGYFPDDAIERVQRIQQLRQEGMNMDEIVSRMAGDSSGAVSTLTPVHNIPTPRLMNTIADSGLHVTLEDNPHPAYMINQSFEVIWLNEEAKRQFFADTGALPSTSKERNLFSLLAANGGLSKWSEVIDFHLGLAKGRLSIDAFGNLCRSLSNQDSAWLQQRYAEVEAITARPIAETLLAVPRASEANKTAYASFFREGILVAYTPTAKDSESLLDLLPHRDEVIRTLRRRRLPALTQLAVLVTDLQSSVKICAELPPEEYFELINEMWALMETVFRKYHGTYGKHVADGMVYYFFPQPDSDYLMNALACAVEIRREMQKLSKAWQLKKNWLNELYLNTGIAEGHEWLGTFQSSTSVEFVVLGDSINQAARISDFARHGAIWATKSLIGKLPAQDRARLRYGVRRQGLDGQQLFVASTFSMVSSLLEHNGPKSEKLRDIATLPITEIVEVNDHQF